MPHPLDNIMWNSLSGLQVQFSCGTDAVRRYAPGFSPIIGFADTANPDLAALSEYCEPGEHFYCSGWQGDAPPGWQVEVESTMFKMVWQGNIPEMAMPDAQVLNSIHVRQALDLAQLTKPGPFGLRTMELGAYYGCFEGERLIAMAGERMHAGVFREISGVCTHPAYQGRGLARNLMLKLIRMQMQNNQIPFLHVMRDNLLARQMYERMGFANYQETVVRVIGRC